MSKHKPWLHEDEILEVIKGLRLRLEQLLEAREDRDSAEHAFHALYRLTRGKPGRPKYPEFNWDFIQYFLDHYESYASTIREKVSKKKDE